MEKVKCFEIEKRELYLEQVLVELNFPILFVCRDKQHDYYVAMCTDAYKLTYLVGKCSSTSIAHMILGKITMRQFWMENTEYWRISTGHELKQDVVVPVTADLLDESELPEDKKYIIDDNVIKEYAISLNRKQSYEMKFSNDYFHYALEKNENYVDGKVIQEQKKQLLKENKSTMSIKEENFPWKQTNSEWESVVNYLDGQLVA